MTKHIEKLTDLQPDQGNANLGTERGQYMLDESIAQVGAARSIVTDRDGVVIAGNKTLQAAVDAGLGIQVIQTDGNELVVVQRTDLDLDGEGDEAERARLAAYFDNRASEVGLSWDAEQIAADIAAGMDFGPMFGDDELADILSGLAPEPEPDPGAQIDKAAELQQKWDTALGQIWEVGRHRIVCGDCTDAAIVEALMQGEKARLVWTDPPYGVKYGDKLNAANPVSPRVRSIENDNLPAAELEAFIRAAFMQAASASSSGASIYAACPPGTLLPTAIAAFVGSGFEFRWQLVWIKDQLVLSRADYHFRHENLLYGWKPGAAHYFTEDRTQDSVFEVSRPKVSEEHPTMKPPELIARMLQNSSVIGNIVLDPFLGSASTLVACEQLGRIGRGIEIEPKYVAVSLERLAGMGLEPKLVGTV